ncbi:membrane protein [Pseudoalteromonas ulvae UL12]|uniref:Smp protein n=1 Tax=Pseudoalteromonas ulvae TaxID=107327 RepID=A0A244CU08_PSEDV|nr:AhpA/YtjB family protein [Pseudoalteromonas ulvae]MBE0362923.1 membrane protein [Pseudoalteromonas ulvae UL12]OUL59112.1 smp protein [Pseudoalteromonas ulvae]
MKKTQLQNPAVASIYQRITRLSLALLCLFIFINIAFNTSFESHEILLKQSHTTARSLALQMSLTARDAIKEDDNTALQRIVDNVVKDPHVQSAAIFDQHGLLISKSANGYLYKEQLNQPKALPGISKLLTPVIEPITSKSGKRLGFVRLTYLSMAAMNEGHSYFHQLGRQIGLMLILCIVGTWLIARTIKRWQVMRYIRKISLVD